MHINYQPSNLPASLPSSQPTSSSPSSAFTFNSSLERRLAALSVKFQYPLPSSSSITPHQSNIPPTVASHVLAISKTKQRIEASTYPLRDTALTAITNFQSLLTAARSDNCHVFVLLPLTKFWSSYIIGYEINYSGPNEIIANYNS